MTTALALVAHKGQWKLQNVTLRPLLDDEVVVRIVACGICLADIHTGDSGDETSSQSKISSPRVLGHEGSGYVERIGANVTTVQTGDPVILSYLSCGACYTCLDGHPSYCIKLLELNLGGNLVYAPGETLKPSTYGQFFGQSSFASRALVKGRVLVNVKGLIQSDDELKMLAPLGCGIQTGSGTILRVAAAQRDESVAILGVGGVGLSAIMAAKLCECFPIVAIDRVQSRLDLAVELGATHTINTSLQSTKLVKEVLEITGGQGVHIGLDTTGVQVLARQMFDFVRINGRILRNGLALATDTWDVPMAELMNTGKRIIGAVEGDAIPQDYILGMIRWYQMGRFPVNKLVKFYPITEFQQALDDNEEWSDRQASASVRAASNWKRFQADVMI